MEYQINASSESNKSAVISIKESQVAFGTTEKTAAVLPNPAELFLGSFSACMLKNVERFSVMMKFTYHSAALEVSATRLDRPPKIEHINYHLTIFGADKDLNISLLKRNIEKFGTIYNTIKQVCSITGEISVKEHV